MSQETEPAHDGLHTAPERPRLDFLDGLRGLAALYVTLFHARSAIVWTGHDGGLPRWAEIGTLWIGFGRFAVAVFIVMSGYVLMLPVVVSGKGVLKGGFGPYVKRRARRILPPYYATLIVAFGVNLWATTRYDPQGIGSNLIRPDTSVAGVLSHLLLVHNLFPAHTFTINFPMWSVATEWQIYFAFPLLLILWRQVGSSITVLVAFLFGLLPHLLSGGREFGSPWFLGLFSLGMAGAVVNFWPAPKTLAIKARIPWGILTGLFSLAFVTGVLAAGLGGAAWLRLGGRWVLDTLVGLATVCLVVGIVNAPKHSRGGIGLVRRVLEMKWIVGLGTMSYSLYLLHALVLGVVHLLLIERVTSPLLTLGFLLTVGTGLSLATAWAFFTVFERRFLPDRRRREAAR